MRCPRRRLLAEAPTRPSRHHQVGSVFALLLVEILRPEHVAGEGDDAVGILAQGGEP